MPNNRTDLTRLEGFTVAGAPTAGEWFEHAEAFPDDIEDTEESGADLTSTKFVSSRAGSVIKSKRKFGVEFEVNLGATGQRQLRGLLASEFGMVHDGSVNDGIEVVSPILGGSRGEKQVILTCEALAKVKAGADDSCGMHVHLDSPEFYCETNCPLVTLDEALRVAKSKEYENHRFIILHSSTITELKKENNALYERLLKHRGLDTFSYSAWDSYLDKVSTYRAVFTDDLKDKNQWFLVAPNGSRGSRVPFHNYQDLDELGRYRGEPVLTNLQYSTRALVDPQTSQGALVLMIDVDELRVRAEMVERLKRVAAFYIAFDGVIASTLPCDRRDNDFSKRLNVRVSIGELQPIKTMLDFFNVLSRTKSLSEFNQSLSVPRHESRYTGVNFRSLLKHGTIEIRYHAGTIDSGKILRWTALHQRIIDVASDLNNPRLNLDRLAKAAMIVDMNAKTNLFFKKLNLEPSTEKYFLDRIELFKGEDSVFVDSLIEDDKLKN